MEEKSVLKVENLNVELEEEKILENLSFGVREGEVLTILGPNGAGKTVLLKTFLLVTHDLSIVYKFATNCLCLNKKVLCYNTPKELTTERLSQLYGGEIKFHEHKHD